jgi:hypothetical protein
MVVKVSPRLAQLLSREEKGDGHEVLLRLWRQLEQERQTKEPQNPSQQLSSRDRQLLERVRFSRD